jgi:hypothetical protein
MSNNAFDELVETQIREILYPEMAFLMANDPAARHSPSAHLIAEYGSYLWAMLSTGVAGFLLKEVAKGAAGQFGKALVDRMTKRGGAVPKEPGKIAQADHEAVRTQLAETTALLREMIAVLKKQEERTNALEAGKVAVAAALLAKGFPKSRAAELAAAFHELAAHEAG